MSLEPWCCLEVVKPLRGGAYGRELGPWGHAPEGECEALPAPSFPAVLGQASFLLPAVAMTFCLIIGSKAVVLNLPIATTL